MSGNVSFAKHFANISATTGAFLARPGQYSLVVIATFGGGSVQLQILGGDGTTWVNVGAAVTANSYNTIILPEGQYQFVITTATAVYIDLAGF